jgi:hypothetical protein
MNTEVAREYLPVGVRSKSTAEFNAALHEARVISRQVEFGDPVFYDEVGHCCCWLAVAAGSDRFIFIAESHSALSLLVQAVGGAAM